MSDINIEQVYWDLMVSGHKLGKSVENLIGNKDDKKTAQDIVKVVFVRHGQSTANGNGVFSGWLDVPLSDQGEAECREAGQVLRKAGFSFDVAYTSLLCRAVDTTNIILDEMGIREQTELKQNWRLNERHYGKLQGKGKKQTVDEFGKE